MLKMLWFLPNTSQGHWELEKKVEWRHDMENLFQRIHLYFDKTQLEIIWIEIKSKKNDTEADIK